MNNVIEQNNKKRLIKYITVGVLIFNIISVMLIITGIMNGPTHNKIQYIAVLYNIVIWVMALGSCLLYFIIYKEKDIFFISQTYIVIGLEYIYIYYMYGEMQGNRSSCTVFLFVIYLYRTIIIYFTINNNTTFAKVLYGHKILATITTCLVFFIVVMLEMIMNILNIKVIETKPMIFLSAILIIYNFYLMINLAKKSFKKNQVLYIIFVASINIFNIRKIFYTITIFILKWDIDDFFDILTFVGFIVLIFGLFIEFYYKITEDNRINEKMKLSEYKLKSITENILDMIFTIDSKGRITYLNRAISDALGCRLEEALGKSYKAFMVDNHLNVDNILSGDINKGTLVKHKISYEGKNEIEVESLIRRVTKDNGDIEGYIVVSRNTQMRRELEALTVKYNEIKEYNKIRTDFFANLSHEVRTPINIIYSCLQLLNKEKEKGNDKLSECYIKYEKTINQNCFRIVRLINNIIDVTKIDSGYLDMNFVNHDIILLVEDLTMSVVPLVKSKGISIVFDTNLEENIIKCDLEQIERVMLNLIANAVKFTEPGGEILVDVNIDVEWVNIRVKDTGIGIPIGMREVIFERFVQTDKSLNRRNEGSGIGLALVKSIIISHEGMVSLEKSDEKGSVFLVQLPNKILDDMEVISREMKSTEENKINQMIGIEFSDIYDIYEKEKEAN